MNETSRVWINIDDKKENQRRIPIDTREKEISKGGELLKKRILMDVESRTKHLLER